MLYILKNIFEIFCIVNYRDTLWFFFNDAWSQAAIRTPALITKIPPITESVSLGDVLCGTAEGRTSEKEVGQVLKLWDDPYLA